MKKSYTTGAARMVSRCCGHWPYRLAKDNLAELCQIHLSATTIGNMQTVLADKIDERLENIFDVRSTLQKAKGVTGFYADGTFVHICNEDDKAERREFKVGAYAKRRRGLFAFPSEWPSRTLPEPSVVSAFASIAYEEEFLKFCQSMRRHFVVECV